MSNKKRSPVLLTEAMRKPRRQRAMVTDKQVAAYDATEERIMRVATAENARIAAEEKALHESITSQLRAARDAAGESWASDRRDAATACAPKCRPASPSTAAIAM